MADLTSLDEVDSAMPPQHGTRQVDDHRLGAGSRHSHGYRNGSVARAASLTPICEAKHSVMGERCCSPAVRYVDGHHACWLHATKYMQGGQVEWLVPSRPCELKEQLKPPARTPAQRRSVNPKPEGVSWEEWCEIRWAKIEQSVCTVGGRYVHVGLPEPG